MDYSKLGKSRRDSGSKTLVELFDQLDRKATHNSLRLVQIEALQGLQSQIDQRDLLLKISTGSGKTLVGLIYAELLRRKYPGEPSMYLCPTNQLVDQVLDSATKIGVPAEAFPSEGLPHRALEGKAVLVCTYDRLFNARSVLVRRHIVPCAIVLDDVHSGIEKVRQKYTLAVPESVYPQIIAIFQGLCEATDPAIWRGIASGSSSARYEVPYWLWIPQAEAVAELLESHKDDEKLRFEWSNVARYMEYARLCISGESAELSLPVAAVEENTTYSSAKHRLFMSASIKDGSSLLRDLALDPSSLARIIEPPSDRGAGERMVLPIALIDAKLEKREIAEICKQASSKGNVVVLTSSTKQADAWVTAGAQFKKGKEVDTELNLLRTTKNGRYVVFAQRYDGVDLPDDACRILVIDEVPTGERLCDQIDASRQLNSPGYNSRAVNRFEQALGRAVRSSADYAAVLLVGNEIAAFIGRKDVKEALEPHTREQIELGQDIAEGLRLEIGSVGAIQSAIETLISRDDGWKEAHRQRVSSAEKKSRIAGDLSVVERAALGEREAWICAKARNHQGAVQIFQRFINEPSIHQLQKAELMFRAAGYLHRIDPGQAAALYQRAFQENIVLPRPMEIAEKRYARVKKQSVNVRDYLREFTSANAALARIEGIRATLAYSGDAETVERGLKQLGDALGACSSRPERETNRGPDVLWLFDTIGFCIEAKNEKVRPIHKKDAEQLLLSHNWCSDHSDLDTASIAPVFATNIVQADREEDISFGPRFMTEAVIQEIINRLRTVLTGLSYDGPLFADMALLDQRLAEARLQGTQLLEMLQRAKLKRAG